MNVAMEAVVAATTEVARALGAEEEVAVEATASSVDSLVTGPGNVPRVVVVAVVEVGDVTPLGIDMVAAVVTGTVEEVVVEVAMAAVDTVGAIETGMGGPTVTTAGIDTEVVVGLAALPIGKVVEVVEVVVTDTAAGAHLVTKVEATETGLGLMIAQAAAAAEEPDLLTMIVIDSRVQLLLELRHLCTLRLDFGPMTGDLDPMHSAHFQAWHLRLPSAGSRGEYSPRTLHV